MAEKLDTKTMFLNAVEKNIERPGIKYLLEWLEDNGFYTAPASTKHHGASEGGLLEHSFKVYENLQKLAEFYSERRDIGYIPAESIAIVALFHDVCKVDCYKKDEVTGKYYFDEKFKYGSHGGKSVFILQQFIRLTQSEATAINNHMGAFENERCGDVYKSNHLAWLLHVADEEAAYLQKV